MSRGDIETLAASGPDIIQAEMAMLGGMMQGRSVCEDVYAELRPETLAEAGAWARPAHLVIAAVIRELFDGGHDTGVLAVQHALARRGELGSLGPAGPVYLTDCLDKCPVAVNAGYLARAVIGPAIVNRRIDILSTQMGQRAWLPTADPDDTIRLAREGLDAIEAGLSPDTPEALDVLLPAILEDLEVPRQHAEGVPTGFADLDAVTGKLQPGRMYLIAARPAMGKSTLGRDIARAASVHGSDVRDDTGAWVRKAHVTQLHTLEMSREEMIHGLIAAEARVEYMAVRDHQITYDQWERIGRHYDRLAAAPLYIDESPDCTPASIARTYAALTRTGHRPAVIIVDYLQLMTPPRGKENRQVEVSSLSRMLKLLAKRLNVVLIVLAQLNRGPENRHDHKPLLADLRESGALEQDADAVILLHREDAYDQDSPRAGEADFILAKHRHGPTTTIAVAFQGHYARFVDMAPLDGPPGQIVAEGVEGAGRRDTPTPKPTVHDEWNAQTPTPRG